MELPVVLFVLIVIGAVVIGLLAGLGTAAWRARRRAGEPRSADEATTSETSETTGLAEQVAALESELQDATAAAEAAEQDRAAAAAAHDDARRRLEDAERELATARTAAEELEHRVVAAERVAEQHQQRFRDIVGLESENATLRAIAGRVRELEARLADLADGTIIDLRDEVAVDPTSADR